MSNPKPMPTDDLLRREGTTKLIRELAVRPPVKGMAEVKAATEVFAANLPDAEGDVEAASNDHTASVPHGGRNN